MGGMSGVGRGTETAADSSPDYRFGAPNNVPGADAPPALGMEQRLDEHQQTSPNEQLVGQLISSLDQQQILLVRLRMPQAVLQGCIDELQKATSVGVIVSKESVDALVVESVLSLNTLGDVEITSAVAASGLLEKLAASQNALVVDGSVEQIRQQLANLWRNPVWRWSLLRPNRTCCCVRK